MMIFSKKHLQEEIDEQWAVINTLKFKLEALTQASEEWKKTTAKVNIMADMNDLEFVEMERHLHVQRKEPQNSRD